MKSSISTVSGNIVSSVFIHVLSELTLEPSHQTSVRIILVNQYIVKWLDESGIEACPALVYSAYVYAWPIT